MQQLDPGETGRRGRQRDASPVERRAYRIDEYCAAYRISRSAFYNLVGAGKLRPIRLAGRQLITVEEAERLAAEALLQAEARG